MKPFVCGDDSLYVPEACEECAVTCDEFREYKEYVEDELDSKQDLLTAGDNITIEKDEDTGETIISAPNVIRHQDLVAGDNISILDDGETIVISATGGGGECTCTKQEVMDCLGVREMDIALTDTNGNKAEYIVLGRLKSEPSGGTPISGCSCTKEELLAILGYGEIDISMTDIDGSDEVWTLLGKPKA